MPRDEPANCDLPPLRPATGRWEKLHRFAFALFLLQWAFTGARSWLAPSGLAQASWPDVLLLGLAAATTLIALARHLPGQNVLLAMVLIAALSGGAELLGWVLSSSFTPAARSTSVDGLRLAVRCWSAPLFWIVAILNSRGVARLVLRSWRQRPNYGIWLLGLTAALAMLMSFAFEFYDAGARPYKWGALARVFGIVLLLGLVTPTLINKRPVPEILAFHPLCLWLLLNSLFLIGTVRHQGWLPLAVLGPLTAGVAILALGAGRPPD